MEINLARQSLRIPIRESHDVGDARRQALQIAKDLNFNETASGRVGIVVTEIAGNLPKHSGGGLLLLRVLKTANDAGIEIMSIDDGPGMDVQRCMEDGYSTAGSPGTGLGAIKRLSATLDIYSLRDKGTVLVAELWPNARPALPVDVGAVCVPVTGEQVCGDGWAVRTSDDGMDLVVTDGLGHGPVAAEATRLAIDAFERKTDAHPAGMVEIMHGALRVTRGAAVLTARIDFASNTLICSGVGNVAGYVMTSPKPKGLVSMNGIVGHQTIKPKEFRYDCNPGELVILHSDGLTTHWKLDDFPGLTARSSSVIAGMMFKHFQRSKDDATVLVVRR